MMNSNAFCAVRKVTGFDLQGQVKLGSPVTERCAIVRLKQEVQHTTVRADGSQSRGHADEFVANNSIHLDSNTSVELGDQISVAGFLVRITSMNPCFDVLGPLDHYECGGQVWA